MSNVVTPEIIEQTKKSITRGPITYLNVAGLIPEVMEERHVRVRLPATALHMNHVNILYAGSYFMAAEASGASLIRCTYGSKYLPIIKSCSLDYIKPAVTDLVIDLTMTEEEAKERIAYVEEKGKGRYPMEIPVHDAEGNLVAKVDIIYYLTKS